MTCFLEMPIAGGVFRLGHIERMSIKESPCPLNDSIFVIELGCAREKVILLGSGSDRLGKRQHHRSRRLYWRPA